ncbi:helix-turn-helix domain-containing protein [Polluticoccus soli]|uniref:helix-turn-helix domain-containing protein n=1 Tax=Polluticoccus soli TaxID=3034150 RepID=UPI003B82DD12
MKLTTKFCSLQCGQRNYKKTKRDEKIGLAHQQFKATRNNIASNIVERRPNEKPYLSIKDACTLLNASDTTIRRAIKDGKLKTIRISKKHIIRREDIEQLFKLT